MNVTIKQHMRPLQGHALRLAASLAVIVVTIPVYAAPDENKLVGPNECAECHTVENEVWKETHHFKTFREMPRSKEVKKIKKALGIKRIKRESLCLSCHFTSVSKRGKLKPVAGISCESCHNPARDWLNVHSEFSGKKKETESPEEEKQRWKESEAAGMIRPHMMYQWATNCYSCHIVPKEKLVNEGGHPAGSKFELVSWSQGEIRHNVWWNDAKENRKAPQNQKRMIYVVGTAVELEASLRAVGEATEKKKYAVTMAKRAKAASERVQKIAKVLSVPELDEIAKAAAGAPLKLNNKVELTDAADRVADATTRFATKYDGSAFAAIDKMIPGEDKYKGQSAR